MRPSRPRHGLWQRLVIALPGLWLALFFVAPFGLVAKVSLSQAVLGQPPYAPRFDWGHISESVERLRDLSGAAYASLAEDPLYIQSYLDSLAIAAIATLLTLLVAYPFAYALARSGPRLRPILLLLAVAPFWTSFLIRIYALILLLKDEGLINHALIALHVIDAPLPIFATNGAVVIGIVYSYLPFMILPIYTSIEKQDSTLLEAAADLGASAWGRFWRITVPLSWPGILAGVFIVFIPAVGEFVIPDLLGGSDTLMIGATLWSEFFANRDWPTACAVAIILLLLLIVPLIFYERLQMRGEARL